MPDFRFRAAAALELRRQQETTAGTHLARAEALCREAEAQLRQADDSRRVAQETLRTAARGGIDAWTLDWHRAWIARLGDAVDTCRREVETRAQDVRQAEAAWREARRKRLALERMRERAWRRFQQAQLHEEMKVIDELARLRFIADSSSDSRQP